MSCISLLTGLSGSTDLARGRIFGWKRARLAFVGDMKDDRLLLGLAPFRGDGPRSVFSTVTAIEVEGDVLRRFDGDESMF